MMDQILAKFADPQFLVTLLVSIGCATTVLLAFVPLLQKDDMARRMRAVSTERERIRLRERERLAASSGQNKVTLRHRSGGMTKRLVESLKLNSWLNTDTAKMKLAMAGFRGQGAENAFLAFRLVAPIVFFFAGVVYCSSICNLQWSFMLKLGACDRLRLSRHQGAGDLSQQQDRQAAEDDGPRLSQHGGLADHLRRIRHVDRARGAQGQPGDRHRKRGTGRGDVVAGRRNVLSRKSPRGVREPRQRAPASMRSSN